MNRIVVCREVRPAVGNSDRCIIVASSDDPVGSHIKEPAATSNLAEAKARLHAQGVVLGGGLKPVSKTCVRNGMKTPIEIIVRNEQGEEVRFIADDAEAYSLSSGSTLHYLDIAQSHCDCRWLLGRTLELTDPEMSAVVGP